MYRQDGENSEQPPTEPGIMDLMAEIRLADDYKKGTAATVWLKGGNVLNGHHEEAAGRTQQDAGQQAGNQWPEDELGEHHVADLGEMQVGHVCLQAALGGCL